MIYVNIDGLENISDLITTASAKSDNEYYRIKDTAAELHDNSQFQTYPQYLSACEALYRASDEMNQLNEKLKALDVLVKSLPQEYSAKEKEKQTLIENAINTLDLINSGLSNALLTTDNIGIQVTEENKLTDEVQKLVGEEYIRLSMTDIEPISNKVQEEYEVKTVVPIIPVTRTEEIYSNEEE